MAVDDGTDDMPAHTDASPNGSLKRPSSPQENGDAAPTGDGEDDDTKQPSAKQRKLDEFTKLWATVNDNPKDFQAWTMLLQHVDQQVVTVLLLLSCIPSLPLAAVGKLVFF